MISKTIGCRGTLFSDKPIWSLKIVSNFPKVSIEPLGVAQYLDGSNKIYGIWIQCLVGGLEHGFYFSIDWECHHPN